MCIFSPPPRIQFHHTLMSWNPQTLEARRSHERKGFEKLPSGSPSDWTTFNNPAKEIVIHSILFLEFFFSPFWYQTIDRSHSLNSFWLSLMFFVSFQQK